MTAAGPAQILETIPGWEHASWRPLEGSRLGNAWVVEAAGTRGVLKIDARERSAPLNDRLEEARIQARAAEAGVANAVFYASPTVLLTEYVEGDTWQRADLDSDVRLDRLAQTLQRVHALPLTGRRFDAVAAADAYLAESGDADSLVAGRCHATIRAAPPGHDWCCCHNDLVAANIFDADGGVRLLDWEYACDNDPLFDLATVVAHHRLNSRRAIRLLDAYFDGDGKRWRQRLAEKEIVYDALTWLWRAAEAAKGRPTNDD